MQPFQPLRIFADVAARKLIFGKWLIPLLLPVLVFSSWAGGNMLNRVLIAFFEPSYQGLYAPTPVEMVQLLIFFFLFYCIMIAVIGYAIALDSGKQFWTLWFDLTFLVLVPLLSMIIAKRLELGMALSVVILGLYLAIKQAVVKGLPQVEREVPELGEAERKAQMRMLAAQGSFWFATILGLSWLVLDAIFFLTTSQAYTYIGSAIARAILLPILGYVIGMLTASFLTRQLEKKPATNGKNHSPKKQNAAKVPLRVDMPLSSKQARNFFLILLIALVIFFPVIDPIIFGSGSGPRLGGYSDMGYYIILALGLNIVVGFAGLLDLGYVAFFAIGAYVWAFIGSPHLNQLAHMFISKDVGGWIFWPMLLIAALITMIWGVLLGVPTLRLKGDYLAIVTLGFGEIVPIVFINLRQFTNGTNGIVGVYSPSHPLSPIDYLAPGFLQSVGIDTLWESYTFTPYYYLILALICVLIFVNIRLRDSRLGRAWIAIREDEIAAEALGVNLVNTKLWAFAAGAFFSGIAGMYYVAKLGTVNAGNFHAGDSIIYLAMVVIGGLGSIPGVIVGAITVYSLYQFILPQLDVLMRDPNHFLHQLSIWFPTFTFNNVRNLVFGLVLVLVMIFRPEGLWPSARRQRELHESELTELEVTVTSLDEPVESKHSPGALAE